MNTTLKIMKYELYDVIRNKWLVFYTLFFVIIADTLFRFGGGGAKVVLSFMNVMLCLIPLVSIIFGTMYIYHSREFIELLLSQPINRNMLYRGMYLGLAVPLTVAYLIGIGIPFTLHDDGSQITILALLLLSGALLTFVFTALAFLISIKFEDRAKGFGIAIIVWLIFAVLYDGAILVFSFAFADYPLEKPMLALGLFNPIDLARMLILLKSDFSALMGYTGALFKQFFGSNLGLSVSIVCLLAWASIPFYLGSRAFHRKDF